MLKSNLTRYDVTLIYAGFVDTGKIQMASSKERFADLLINNKTIIEFGSRRIRGIPKASVCVISQTSALIIPHILLDLIQ